MNDESADPAVARAAAESGPPDIEAAFAAHVRQTPPLCWMSALSALCAMLISQILVPALSGTSPREFLFALGRWGDFATNLAAISGLTALCFGLYAFVRHSTRVGLRLRLMLAGFAGIFLPTIALSTLFERQRTTTQIVVYALGAAYVLGTLVNTAAARVRRQLFPRCVALLAATMSTLTLVAQALQLVSRTHLSVWQLQAFELLLALGELCYLGLLLSLSALVLPARATRRDRLARLLSFAVVPAVLISLYLAERTLQNEYALLLYHAQRVNLFIDTWPRLYSAPLAVAVAAVLAGGLSGDALRRQGAAGLCLLLSAGFSPHAPGRLLSLALALVLIARTVIGPTARTTRP
jgi:hypothetical protein